MAEMKFGEKIIDEWMEYCFVCVRNYTVEKKRIQKSVFIRHTRSPEMTLFDRLQRLPISVLC